MKSLKYLALTIIFLYIITFVVTAIKYPETFVYVQNVPMTATTYDPDHTYWISPTGTATWENCKSASPLSGTSACALATANTNAQAGDTVYLRGGEYLIVNDFGIGLEPKNSGTIDNRIIFVAYGNEKPIITSTASKTYGIYLSNNDYIKIDGLTVKNTFGWMVIRAYSDHNEVVNSVFSGDTGEEGNVGLQINDMCVGGASYTCPSSHNWIHNNTFTKLSGLTEPCLEGGDIIRIGQAGSSDGNDYNTIEDNILSYAGHALFDSYGRYIVFKNNILHNEPWKSDYSGGTCHLAPIYVDSQYDNKYGHRGMQITGELYPEIGTRDLIEGNRIGYAGVNPNNPGAINFEIAAAKNIVRFNDLYGAMRLGIGFKYNYSGDNRVYRNTLYHNGYGYAWDIYNPANDTRAGISSYTPDSRKNIIKENIIYDSPISLIPFLSPLGPRDITDCVTRAECNNNWLTTNEDPLFINPDISDPMNTTLPDLSLQSVSPAINSGTYLTTVSPSDSGTGTTLIVDDALYFQDGTWGSDLARGVTFFPDWIAVGTIDNVVEIESIDYDTNTITLANLISRNDNNPVWLYKDSSGRRVLYGNAPDIGAYESNYTNSLPDTYTLNITTENGTVTKNPNQETYTAGQEVILEAFPINNSYTFTGWSGALTGSTNPVTITIGN